MDIFKLIIHNLILAVKKIKKILLVLRELVLFANYLCYHRFNSFCAN